MRSIVPGAPAVAVLILLTAAGASAEFNGNIGLTNNYIWRGVTQSDGKPSFQGGVGYTFSPGFYLSLGCASVHRAVGIEEDETGVRIQDAPYLETEWVVGFKKELFKHWRVDLSVLKDIYPAFGSENYPEANLEVTYRFLNLLLAFSNDLYNTNTNGAYYALGFDHEFKYKIRLHGHGGHFIQRAEPEIGNYSDYDIGVGWKFAGVGLDLSAAGTHDRNTTDNKTHDRMHLIVSVSKEF